jgi:hypothetical protein
MLRHFYYSAQAPKGVKERVKSPYSNTFAFSRVTHNTHTHITLLFVKYCIYAYTCLERIKNFLFSEVQSDRASLQRFLCWWRTAAYFYKRWKFSDILYETIRPDIKHVPRITTGLLEVEFITKLTHFFYGVAKAKLCDVIYFYILLQHRLIKNMRSVFS